MMTEFLTESMGPWLLKTTIEGAILIGFVLLLSAAMGRHLRPRWRVALWALVGLKLLVPATLSFVPGIGNLATTLNVKPAPAQIDIAPVAPEMTLTGIEASSNSVFETGTAESLTQLSQSPLKFSTATCLLLIWVTGVVIFLASLIWKQSRFLRKSGGRFCTDRRLLALVSDVSCRLRLNRRVPVMLGRNGSMPAVCGVFQPRLLLPEDWADRFDESGLRHILMHELEHVRFGDVLWNWTAALVNAVHWFNPLVWLATSRFQADRELRCDADTLARLEASERVAYGRTLLHVQETFHAAPAIAGLAPCVRNHPALRQRIAMITKPTTSRSWLNVVFGLAMAGLICLSFGSAAKADGERESGSREGDHRESARDGDREGESERSREGERGDGGRESAREGEKRGARDGELKVTVLKDGVVIGDEKVTLANLRKTLENENASTATIYANEDVPFQNVKTVVNALGNSGIKNVKFATEKNEGETPREGGARDGEMRREGARDGEGGATREGARDGDNPREGGTRDGEMRREGARDGEGGATREGARDGDKTREGGARDGEMRREGARDGEGGATREGARDGDKPREGGATREGARDGEGGGSREGGARDGDMKREGSREGEGSASREGARDSASSSGADEKQISQLTRIYGAYDKDKSKSVTFEEWVAMKNYKLSSDQEKREKGWFDEADSNSDGGITLGEWIDWKSSQGR